MLKFVIHNADLISNGITCVYKQLYEVLQNERGFNVNFELRFKNERKKYYFLFSQSYDNSSCKFGRRKLIPAIICTVPCLFRPSQAVPDNSYLISICTSLLTLRKCLLNLGKEIKKVYHILFMMVTCSENYLLRLGFEVKLPVPSSLINLKYKEYQEDLEAFMYSSLLLNCASKCSNFHNFRYVVYGRAFWLIGNLSQLSSLGYYFHSVIPSLVHATIQTFRALRVFWKPCICSRTFVPLFCSPLTFSVFCI